MDIDLHTDSLSELPEEPTLESVTERIILQSAVRATMLGKTTLKQSLCIITKQSNLLVVYNQDGRALTNIMT